MKTFIFLIINIAIAFGSETLRFDAIQHGLKPMPKLHEQSIASNAMIDLGKELFYDKRLSLKGNISCASCHNTKQGGADGRPTAIGYKDQRNPHHLNTPTVLNTAFSKHYFWDGRSQSLPDQAKGPLQAPFEMASKPKLIEKRLRSSQHYSNKFQSAFGDSNITFDRTVEAIGAYEKTLITRSRYDSFLEGNTSALTMDEQSGLKLFLKKGCIGCHNGAGLGGQAMRKFPLLHHPIWNITDVKTNNALRTLYLSFLSKDNKANSYNDLLKKLGSTQIELLRLGYFENYTEEEAKKIMVQKGCFSCHLDETYKVDKEILKETAFAFKNTGGFLGKEKPSRYFRVPLLRNVARTAPYFHNGNVKTLEDAVKIMVKYQSRSKASSEEIAQLVTFLKALDGPVENY